MALTTRDTTFQISGTGAWRDNKDVCDNTT